MELNHMFPSHTTLMPATYGDDDCRTEVTDLAIDSVTLVFCLIGLLGNRAIRWLLRFIVCRNLITFLIIELVSANFVFLLFMGVLSAIYIMENVSCSTADIFSQKLVSMILIFSYNMGLYMLTAISITECVSILCPLRYHCRRPQCLSALAASLFWVIFIAVVFAVTSLCVLQEHEHCQIALISMYAINLLIFAPSMVISSTILLIKVQCGSQQHQPRQLYLAIFLTVLLFLLFALPLSICNFLQQFGYPTLSSQVVFLLACINSSLNPFIYFLVGNCWTQCSLGSLQNTLRRVFEEQEGNRACSNDIAMDELAPAL